MHLYTKVGLRWGEGGLKDLLDYGELPDQENCEISRWELGTLNYEALAGFCGTEEYLANLAPGVPGLDAAFSAIVEHEEKISARFLERMRPLLERGKLRLLGSTDPKSRTPTFALSQTQVLLDTQPTSQSHCILFRHQTPQSWCVLSTRLVCAALMGIIMQSALWTRHLISHR